MKKELKIFFCIFLKIQQFTLSMVSPQFGACNDFFDYNFFPTGYTMTPNVVELCQNENGKRKDNMFATLYDKSNKIPIYSAYVLDKSNTRCPLLQRWHIEADIPHSEQAVGARGEYTNTDFIRGHLGVNCYKTDEGTESEYALTNSIPEAQLERFSQAQEKSKQIMEDDCLDGTAFYVSGVIPGGKATTNSDINVPGFLYTAACCRKDVGSFSFGFIGENKRNSHVDVLDVVKLGKTIKDNYMLPLKKPIKFFMDDCNYKDEENLKKLRKLINL